MELHGFADIRQFRVRLPKGPLWPFYGRDSLEAGEEVGVIEGCVASESMKGEAGWLSIDDLGEFFPAKFADKNPLNIPGPIYGAETDTCCTGPQESPDNVLLDRNGQEFVFKQASSAAEFRDLVSAAICECFQGYGADGNSHWRLSMIRQWWRQRDEMLKEQIDEQWCDSDSVQQWKSALEGGAEGYLRVYAFFQENGRVPVDGEILPEL